MIKKIAIIGLGSIGKRYLRIFENSYPNINLIIVRATKKKLDYNLKPKHQIIYSINELPGLNVNAAIISTPSSIHIKQANFLVQSGINILIEKPLSDSLNGAKQFANLVAKNGVVALVGYMFRYDPSAIAFKNFIEKKNNREHPTR